MGRMLRGGVGHAGAAPYRILTVTNSGGFALYTTAAPHNLAVSDAVTVSGTSLAQYNAASQTISAVTALTFTTDKAYTAPATGGTWVEVTPE